MQDNYLGLKQKTDLACLTLLCCSILFMPHSHAQKTPPIMRHDFEHKGFYIKVSIMPGIATPNQTARIAVDVAKALPINDPRFGDRKPIDGLTLKAQVYHLAKNKRTKDINIGRILSPLRDVGRYGMHLTLQKTGIYGIKLSWGKKDKMKSVRFLHSVAVWPIPKKYKSEVPAPPAAPQQFRNYDLVAGQQLCKQHCKKNSQLFANSNNPASLLSEKALGMTDKQLLATVIPPKKLRSLSFLEKNDILGYLRNLHMQVERFFPTAKRYTINEYTIDQHGQNRLKQSLGKTPEQSLLSRTVLIAYGPKPKTKDASKAAIKHLQVTFVPHTPRLLDALKPKEKIGYVVFSKFPGLSEVDELAIAMDTRYRIKAVEVDGPHPNALLRLNKQLNSFIGHGAFNDPKSLRKGKRSLIPSFLPIYLTACEAATMFVREENDRFAFDAALAE